MKKILIIIFLLIAIQALKAQTSFDVKGTVLDSTGLSVIAATIKLTSPKDTLQTRTDADGHFSFRNVKSPQFVLSVSSLGYSDFVRRYLFSDKASSITVETITLKAQSNVLNE
ncbi:MAG TPA: carboxypeptidase-like regulatory domain-containing protein, partial [Pedobacter sp.]